MANWRNKAATLSQIDELLRLGLITNRLITAGDAEELLVKAGKAVPRKQNKPPTNPQLKYLAKFNLGSAADGAEADRLIAEHEKSIPATVAAKNKVDALGYDSSNLTEAEAAFVASYYPSVAMVAELDKRKILYTADIRADEAEELLEYGAIEESQRIRLEELSGYDPNWESIPVNASFQWAEEEIDRLEYIKDCKEEKDEQEEAEERAMRQEFRASYTANIRELKELRLIKKSPSAEEKKEIFAALEDNPELDLYDYIVDNLEHLLVPEDDDYEKTKRRKSANVSKRKKVRSSGCLILLVPFIFLVGVWTIF